MLRGELKSSLNFNDITESGIYSCIKSSGITFENAPSDFKDGILIVYNGGRNNGAIIQKYTDYTNNSYIRILWGSSWASWTKITSTIL